MITSKLYPASKVKENELVDSLITYLTLLGKYYEIKETSNYREMIIIIDGNNKFYSDYVTVTVSKQTNRMLAGYTSYHSQSYVRKIVDRIDDYNQGVEKVIQKIMSWI